MFALLLVLVFTHLFVLSLPLLELALNLFSNARKANVLRQMAQDETWHGRIVQALVWQCVHAQKTN